LVDIKQTINFTLSKLCMIRWISFALKCEQSNALRWLNSADDCWGIVLVMINVSRLPSTIANELSVARSTSNGRPFHINFNATIGTSNTVDRCDLRSIMREFESNYEIDHFY
jgi:hypothetical protein